MNNDSSFAMFVLFIVAFVILFYTFSTIVRKKLHVEKQAIFSYNHVNETHKKIDWTLRAIFIVFIVGSLVAYMYSDTPPSVWYMQPYVLVFLFVIINETVRIVIEKKYAKNKNAYKATAMELLFLIVFIAVAFSTNFFGLV